MRFRAIFPVLFVLQVGGLTRWSEGTAMAGTGSRAEALFRQGVDAYQKADYPKARALFVESSQLSGDRDPLVLFDLGLTEFRLGKKGRAAGLWRKALADNADFSPAARALTWTQGQLEHAEIPHEVELWESLRARALVTVPLWNYLLASAALFFASGWLLFRHLGLRRRAELDEKPMPAFPAGAAIASAFLLLALTLTGAKAIDESVVRGTVVEKKIEARSSPASDGTALFDLYEGLEVIVRAQSGDWTQITYPGGSTGWIPRRSLLATNDSVTLPPATEPTKEPPQEPSKESNGQVTQ